MMIKHSRTLPLSLVFAAITAPGCSGLENAWWLGVGGVAQVVAAVLSVLMVWLGLKALRASRQELHVAQESLRRAAVPDWVPVGLGGSGEPKRTTLEYRNKGLAPAQDVQVTLDPSPPQDLSFEVPGPPRRNVLPDGNLRISFLCETPIDWSGKLTLASVGRFGYTHRYTVTIHVFREDYGHKLLRSDLIGVGEQSSA